MPKNKVIVTPDKAVRIVKSLQLFYILAELIKMEYYNDLVDAHFKNPAINQHAKRIKESAVAIQVHVASVLKQNTAGNLDATTEYIGELYRLLDHFVGMDIESITEFLDGIDDLKKAI